MPKDTVYEYWWDRNRQARNLFLRAIETEAGEVLKSLCETVLPVYLTISSIQFEATRRVRIEIEPTLGPSDWEFSEPAIDTHGLPVCFVDLKSRAAYEPAGKLIAALENWQTKYGLRPQWIADRALQCCFSWKASPPMPGALKWLEVSKRVFAPVETLRLTVTQPAWDSDEENWRTFEKRMVYAFTEKLRSRKKEMLKKRALEEVPQSRDIANFRYLVKRKVKKWSINKIATTEGGSEEAIKKGISRKARMVGL